MVSIRIVGTLVVWVLTTRVVFTVGIVRCSIRRARGLIYGIRTLIGITVLTLWVERLLVIWDVSVNRLVIGTI